ncbi:MAG: zinc-binding dehydrogenase [Gammaproteobacteria bacterium]|nr:zinc-binding dehydrogenase [Gammaproteobacteria bacterium]
MKQILQNLKTGETVVEDIPCPSATSGALLVQTTHTLVSAGTERMLVNFGKANLIDKARQQPDKVKMVLDKVKTDGLAPTLQAVRSKLDQPLPMGYCNVGRTLEIGKGVDGFKLGDRVISNGKHAEVVSVPKNLCAKIPDNVSDEEAAFTVIASIALQGIRLGKPTLGECFVVTGLGLIGLVAVQLLRANGCRVLGIDYDSSKIALAQQFGAETVDLSKGEDPLAVAQRFSRGKGVDGVIITASTKSNEPVHQAAEMCRKRGRIILVGVVGLELSRADFYEKELSFQVSCSYGPGRYDSEYEEKGNDYPLPFVRWTEQRNFEAVLDLLAAGQLDVKPLISHRLPFLEAKEAYDVVSNGAPLGILLEFADQDEAELRQSKVQITHKPTTASKAKIGFIGAGNYATHVLIPAFAKTSAELMSVSSNTGISGVHVAKKFEISEATTDTAGLISDDSNNTLVITTRHDSHAGFVQDALEVGKNVFVEKPLAITRDQLQGISESYEQSQANETGARIMVGFNRRFAPQVVKMKQLLESTPEAKAFVMTVNAGGIPADHWTQDRSIGGGRIIGEGCHFVDLLRFLAGAPIISVQAMKMGSVPGMAVSDDKVSINLLFADGSFGTVHYLANGHKSFPKERLEVFCGGAILQLDNFRKLQGYNWPDFKKMNLLQQDKGNSACAAAFVDAIENGEPSPIPFEEIVEVTNACFDVVDQLHE